MEKSSYDKFPFVAVPGAFHECAVGWDKIAGELKGAIARNRTEKPILVVECYPGVDASAVLKELQSRLAPKLTIRAEDAYHSPGRIDELFTPYLRADNLRDLINSSRYNRLSLVNFFDADPLWRFRRTIDELKSGLVLIVGCGASLIAWGHTLVYADLTRREARRRFHRNEIGNLGSDNQSAAAVLRERHATYIDWHLADRWKRPLIKRWDYVLDTHDPAEPKLADAVDVRRGLHAATTRPFRVVPSSRPIDEVRDCERYLDIVLEENSVLLDFAGLRIELPALDLLFHRPRALLGETVHIRFGYEFPIRFSFHDAPIGGLAEPFAHGEGWREERLGLSEHASIETRRHWFTKTVAHDTEGSVNVLKLMEGGEAIVESPARAFAPFIVHSMEAFIVPAAVGRYNIRPHGPSTGNEIATIKASVRIRSFGNRMP